MSYGIQFKNDYGDDTLKSAGLLFEHSTGNAPRSHQMQMIVNNRYHEQLSLVQFTDKNTGRSANNTAIHTTINSTLTVYNDTDGGSFSIQRNIKPLWHSYTNDFTSVNLPNESGLQNQNSSFINHAVPNTDDTSYHYEVFFKIVSGGLHLWTQIYNPYNYAYDDDCKGLHINVQQSSKNNHSDVPYIVAWNKVPTTTSGYGMEVFDSGSNKIFDSRFNAKAIRVKDYLTITASQFEDCLENDTTYNFTLRQPISNAYVGGSPQMNVRNEITTSSGIRWYRPTFKMTSTTNLQMYRTKYVWTNSATRIAEDFGVYNDCLLTILDA